MKRLLKRKKIDYTLHFFKKGKVLKERKNNNCLNIIHALSKIFVKKKNNIILFLQKLKDEKKLNSDLPKINVILCFNSDPCLHQDEINKSIIRNQVGN